jgi:hypothetical protein
MKKLAMACMRILALYLVAAAAMGFLAWRRAAGGEQSIVAGLIGGGILWLALLYLWAIPVKIREWWRLRNAAAGSELRDGERVAVFGTLRPVRDTLRAPFTQAQCVAYKYSVTSLIPAATAQDDDTVSVDYDGFAMVPSAIHTRTGDVRILGFPDLKVPAQKIQDAAVVRNAEAYVAATSFVPAKPLGLQEQLDAIAGNEDGRFRYDARHDPVAPALTASVFEERLARPGEQVCVTGVYSAQRRALLPDPDALIEGLTLEIGDPEALTRKARRGIVTSIIGAIVFCAAFGVAFVAFHLLTRLDAAEQRDPQRRLWFPEVRFERWLDARVRAPLIEAGIMGTRGSYVLDLCPGCAVGRLEIGGRTCMLSRAAARQNATERLVEVTGDGATVQMAFDARRQLTRLDILMDGGKRVTVPPEWLAPGDVETFVGSGLDLQGRATIMAPDDSVRCRTSFAAHIVEEDGSV